MKATILFALVAATVMVSSCNSLTPEKQNDPAAVTQPENKDSIPQNATVPTVIDLQKKSPWTINLFNKDWNMLPGAFKKLPLENSLVSVNVEMVKASYFALESEVPNNDSLGDFDSLTIEYKSNYRFQMTVATTGDITGWENSNLAPRSETEYSRYTFYKKDFERTWTEASESTLKMSSASIIAFGSNDSENLVDGPLTMSIKEIKLYTNK